MWSCGAVVLELVGWNDVAGTKDWLTDAVAFQGRNDDDVFQQMVKMLGMPPLRWPADKVVRQTCLTKHRKLADFKPVSTKGPHGFTTNTRLPWAQMVVARSLKREARWPADELLAQLYP